MVKNAPKTITPIRIDQQLEPDETFLPIGHGFRVVPIPGHARGQLAFLYQDQGGIFFAADACGNMLGMGLAPFYEDLAQGRRDIETLAGLEFAHLAFGHGGAVLGRAAERFRKRFRKWLAPQRFVSTKYS